MLLIIKIGGSAEIRRRVRPQPNQPIICRTRYKLAVLPLNYAAKISRVLVATSKSRVFDKT